MTAVVFPQSLRTATLAEGHALARELAERALAERRESRIDMASHLATAATPSLEALTAVYFQAVAAANVGWSK
ncbi:MAG: hypothetical protein V4773_23610 [Verrucomicrobiota bacterium]